MTPSLAATYVEMTDDEWRDKFLAPATDRKAFLEKNLSIEELVREAGDQYDDCFLWFLGLSFEDQQQVAQQLKAGLEKVKALRDRNRKRARRMLEKHRAVWWTKQI
jgi:hypothetical protein